jgi:hypothetical protein
MWNKQVVRDLGTLDGELSFNLFLNKRSVAPVRASSRFMDPFYPDRTVADSLYLRVSLTRRDPLSPLAPEILKLC